MNKTITETSTNNELFVWGVYVILKHFISTVKN